MEFFGQKLAKLRKEKGLSQEELAIDLHISQASISNYEKGRKIIDIETLQKFCEYFEVPYTYLIDEKYNYHSVENHGTNSGYVVNNNSSDHTDKIIELYELRIKEKDELISFLKLEIEKFKK